MLFLGTLRSTFIFHKLASRNIDVAIFILLSRDAPYPKSTLLLKDGHADVTIPAKHRLALAYHDQLTRGVVVIIVSVFLSLTI